MLRIKKSILIISLLIGVSANAFSVAAIAGKVAEGAVKGLAEALLEKDDDNTLIIDNSDIVNDVKIDDSDLFFSNAGIKITGKEIKISDSEIINDVIVEKGTIAVFSNLGIKLGAGGKVEISSSLIKNTVVVSDAILVGSNVGIEIGK